MYSVEAMVVLPSLTVGVGLQAEPLYVYPVGLSVIVGLLTVLGDMVVVIDAQELVPPLWLESGTAFQ